MHRARPSTTLSPTRPRETAARVLNRARYKSQPAPSTLNAHMSPDRHIDAVSSVATSRTASCSTPEPVRRFSRSGYYIGCNSGRHVATPSTGHAWNRPVVGAGRLRRSSV